MNDASNDEFVSRSILALDSRVYALEKANRYLILHLDALMKIYMEDHPTMETAEVRDEVRKRVERAEWRMEPLEDDLRKRLNLPEKVLPVQAPDDPAHKFP